MPPWSEVWDVLRSVLAPCLGAAAVVYAPMRLVGGERAAPLAAGLALLAGGWAGNLFREAMPWRLDPEQALTMQTWFTAVTGAVSGTAHAVPTRYWLPWLAVAALMGELLVRVPRWPRVVGILLRASIAVLAARLLTPLEVQQDRVWLAAATAGVMLIGWVSASTSARRWPGPGLLVSAGLACALAAGVMLHAHSALLTDLALFPSAALLGVAIVAWRWSGDLGPALVPLAVWLPGLAWAAFHETFSDVPTASFVLVGVTPLAWSVGWLPVRWRRGRRAAFLALLALLPPLIALGLAMHAVRLEF